VSADSVTEDLTTPGPVSVDVMDRAGTALGITWPADYLTFMVEHGGGEGWVGAGYLALWPANALLETNQLAEVQVNAPHLVGIGGDGADELFAFDRSAEPPTLVMVPLVGLDEPVRVGTFSDLLRRLADDDLFIA
jgi:hypothetical protein